MCIDVIRETQLRRSLNSKRGRTTQVKSQKIRFCTMNFWLVFMEEATPVMP